MPERPTSRRQFLRGQSAAVALGSIADDLAGEPPEDSTAERPPQLTLTRRAMACDFQVRLNVSSGQNETAAAMAALDAVERVEERLTVYREASELIELNRQAARGPAPVPSDLMQLFQMVDRLYDNSGGAYDITGGPLSDTWGFSRRQGRIPNAEEIATAKQATGWDAVRLDPAMGVVEFQKPGIRLNANSFGKGYALDVAADVMIEHAVDDFLLHGGRSTLLAHGAQADGSGGYGWGVGLRHPLRPQKRIAEVRLRDSAFSTSGSATQCFIHEGRRLGHLIDPRTGWPAEGLHSVSVIAPTAAEADALSTALFVMGCEQGLRMCEEMPDVQAVFILPGDLSDSIQIRHANLDPECWRLLEVH